jgi:hypothetical protein
MKDFLKSVTTKTIYEICCVVLKTPWKNALHKSQCLLTSIILPILLCFSFANIMKIMAMVGLTYFDLHIVITFLNLLSSPTCCLFPFSIQKSNVNAPCFHLVFCLINLL